MIMARIRNDPESFYHESKFTGAAMKITFIGELCEFRVKGQMPLINFEKRRRDAHLVA